MNATPGHSRPNRTASRPQPRTPEHAPAAPQLLVARDGVRLAKRVAEIASCSRREAEQYIAGGWVQVDGQVVEEPQFRVTGQSIVLASNTDLSNLSPVTLLLHKPADCDDGSASTATGAVDGTVSNHARALLSAHTYASDDPCRLPVLKRHFNQLIASVPLEYAASGLIVFTQDARVLRKLTQDALWLEHEFTVDVHGEVSAPQLQRLNHDRKSDATALNAIKVSVNSHGGDMTRLRFAVKGAHPGQIASMCERLGLKISSMKRLRVGRVTLSALPVGQWRYLMAHERF